jgi:hypothetical protein
MTAAALLCALLALFTLIRHLRCRDHAHTAHDFF